MTADAVTPPTRILMVELDALERSHLVTMRRHEAT